MRFPQPLVPGRFLRWVNRFAALVEVAGKRGGEGTVQQGNLRKMLTPSGAAD